MIGSHNSYKQAIDPALFNAFSQKDSASASSLDYEHIPVTAQLDLGLRNLEIDVYPDEKGGKYANPKGLEMVAGQKPYDPQGKMKQPGFKVLHVPDLDFRSHYFTLIDCLQDLKAWSEAHPDHTPVYITGLNYSNVQFSPRIAQTVLFIPECSYNQFWVLITSLFWFGKWIIRNH